MGQSHKVCICSVIMTTLLTFGCFGRLGGAAGTNLQTSQCPNSGSGGTTNCFAAFLALHLTSQSTAYLEVSAAVTLVSLKFGVFITMTSSGDMGLVSRP